MTQIDPIAFASQLCSRLCHDLLSPVGALSNGLELMADETDPAMRERCLDLLEQSAATSAAKLKFFRLAFGAGGGFGDKVDIAEPRDVIQTLAHDAKRIELAWALEVDSLPKPAAKVLLNFAHMAIEALVRGGTLDIGAERRDGAHEIVVRAQGVRIAFDESVGAALDGDIDPAELTGRTAPAYMLHLLAEKAGGAIQYQRSDTMLLLGAEIPEGEGWIG
ncbi:histidine phosphotransferase [Erythrobacter sp. 3-20A1M]|uniref:histidine phosphotransferase family protein n=1 Tax=Erythrobacter sp. 3-20A1M TaxID=2653850 RepID=UPI001BFCA3E1|nr:histidine phosphotransferase family protein [Erythrobacter sp. 3-20A1M]QWC56275.1 histidine phosphotransferase [Erythrobacter sp. 3-20A1M]